MDWWKAWVSPVTFRTTSSLTFALRSRMPNTGIFPAAPRPQFPFLLLPNQDSAISISRERTNDVSVSKPTLIAGTNWKDHIPRYTRDRVGKRILSLIYPIRRAWLPSVPVPAVLVILKDNPSSGIPLSPTIWTWSVGHLPKNIVKKWGIKSLKPGI